MTDERPTTPEAVYWPAVKLVIGIWSDELRNCGANLSHIQIEINGPSPQIRIKPFVSDFNRGVKRMTDISDRLSRLTPPSEAASFHRRFLRAMRRISTVMNRFVEAWNATRYNAFGTINEEFQQVAKSWLKLVREAHRRSGTSPVNLSNPIDVVA